MDASKGRRHAALLVLAVSVIAIIATTPGPPTIRAEAEGDIGVGADEPARVVVRYEVPAERADEITSIEVTQSVADGWSDHRFRVTTQAALGERVYPASMAGISIPPADCRDGCTIDAVTDVRWSQSGGAALRMAWTSDLAVVYESSVPSEEPRAAIVAGHAPPMPRAGWLALGAAAAAGATIGLGALGLRLRRTRLLLAGSALMPAAWLLWGSGEVIVWQLLHSRFGIRLEELATAGGVLLLGTLLGVGLWRAAHGRATVLRVAGWIGLLVVGFTTWVIVNGLPTYRPHELVVLSLALGMPIGAAITAQPLGDVRRSWERSMPTGTALVMTAQILMLGLVVIVDGYLFTVTAISIARGHFRPDPASIGIGALAIAILWGFVAGLKEWRGGSRVLLGLTSAPVALLVAAAGVLTIAQGDSSLLSIGWEAKVASALATLVVLIGAIGIWLVPPPGTKSTPDAPSSDDERHGERRQGEEVPRITDERDGDDTRDGV